MEYDYVYGELRVSLTLKAEDDSFFGQLTPGQMQCLGQSLYLALNCFSIGEALRQIDLIDRDKIRGSENEKESDNEQMA